MNKEKQNEYHYSKPELSSTAGRTWSEELHDIHLRVRINSRIDFGLPVGHDPLGEVTWLGVLQDEALLVAVDEVLGVVGESVLSHLDGVVVALAVPLGRDGHTCGEGEGGETYWLNDLSIDRMVEWRFLQAQSTGRGGIRSVVTYVWRYFQIDPSSNL